MKTTKQLIAFLIAVSILVAAQSCTRLRGCTDAVATNYNSRALADDGTCTYATTFYFDQNGPNATVNIGTQSQIITTSYPNGNQPVCGLSAVGCANFALITGNYRYTASSDSNTWSGTIGVTNSCAFVLLPQRTAPVTFWTDNTNYGTITVNINGATGTINTFPIDAPACGATGCANFNLAPGTYSYTVNSVMYGQITTGIVTVTGDVCQTVEFD